MRISCSASSISVPVFLKSKRLATSQPVWSTAFRTSWRSTSETTSKVGILKRYLQAPQGRYPSGQRGQTVNLLAQPTVVRIHPGPPKTAGTARIPAESFSDDSVRELRGLGCCSASQERSRLSLLLRR